jgi:hypothetical protein
MPKPPEAMFSTFHFPSIRIVEDKDCRSTEEFRDEMVALPRTWRERFVDGPVWAPKPALHPPKLMSMGIPVAYSLGPTKDRPHTIMAHPELAAKMKATLR